MLRLLLVAAVAACSIPVKPDAPTAPAPVAKAEPAPPAPAPKPEEPSPALVEDPHRWLEDVTAEPALAWARERNKRSQAELEGVPGFGKTRDRVRAIYDSKEKLPFVTVRGKFVYNFWTDEKNPKGLLRRTTLAEFRKAQPAWETVLDIDALSTQERESWVYKSAEYLYPAFERSLVHLSRGGGDAVVIREFDTVAKRFVPDGFVLPEAKTDVAWKDRDTLYVGTDFGPGTLTRAGYPRIVKEWKRGTPLASATLIYEAKAEDMGAFASRSWDHGTAYDVFYRAASYFSSEVLLRDAAGALARLETPLDAQISIWNGYLLVTLRSDWKTGEKTWPRGALIAARLDAFRAGKRDFTMLFEPTPQKSLAGSAELKSALILNELEDIKNRLYVWTPPRTPAGTWTKRPLVTPAIASTYVMAMREGSESDDYWLLQDDFLTPSTLSLGSLGGGAAKALKHEPAVFDAAGLVVEQHFATSKDGTKIPYFQIARDKLALDGTHPTVLYGYGGFEVSQAPYYSGSLGALWLERGGVYVVANIRGGGEYGPAWHQAAKTHNRQRAFDDFIAVAEDLIARKVTSTPKLGIVGGSNGGLLTGVMLVQRPDLFGAIVCEVPLLDMKRYHKLLAGASWMEEYGDPDKPEDWAAIAKYSPYQNVKRGVKYPRTLFTSSTRDDRVHPGHARKMVARMIEQGHDVLYYENLEGGHAGAADNIQKAYLDTLSWAFFAKQLGLPLAP
jgi:prolyl oligopeptidase